MPDITALGELLIDFTLCSTDANGYPTMAAHAGGAVANLLAAAAKFGADTALLAKVGDDAFGKLLRTTMEKAGIATAGLITDSTVFTTLAFVTLDEKGERSFSFARKPGADTCISFEELDLSILDNTKIFHFGTLSLTDEPARTATQKAIAYAKEKGKLITCDPNLRLPLWKSPEEAKAQMLWSLQQADVVKISDDEVQFLFGLDPQAGAEHIFTHFAPSLVFVTCGSKGCFYKNRNAAGHAPSLQGLKIVDTTGAGDIFGGSALWKLLQFGKHPQDLTEAELRQMAVFACTAASLSATKPGGVESVPDMEEINSYL